MGYAAADRLVTEARNLGFEVVRIDPARQIHSAEDITLVNPTGSTIGYMIEDVSTGRHHFVPIDGLASPPPGPGRARSSTVPGTAVSIRRWMTRGLRPRTTTPRPVTPRSSSVTSRPERQLIRAVVKIVPSADHSAS
jgi:hypothetical protein